MCCYLQIKEWVESNCAWVGKNIQVCRQRSKQQHFITATLSGERIRNTGSFQRFWVILEVYNEFLWISGNLILVKWFFKLISNQLSSNKPEPDPFQADPPAIWFQISIFFRVSMYKTEWSSHLRLRDTIRLIYVTTSLQGKQASRRETKSSWTPPFSAFNYPLPYNSNPRALHHQKGIFVVSLLVMNCDKRKITVIMDRT
jgi:hypothetical protein